FPAVPLPGVLGFGSRQPAVAGRGPPWVRSPAWAHPTQPCSATAPTTADTSHEEGALRDRPPRRAADVIDQLIDPAWRRHPSEVSLRRRPVRVGRGRICPRRAPGGRRGSPPRPAPP